MGLRKTRPAKKCRKNSTKKIILKSKLYPKNKRYMSFVSYKKPKPIETSEFILNPVRLWQLHKGHKVFDKEFNFIGTVWKSELGENYWNLKICFKEWSSRKYNGTYQKQY